MMSIRQCFQCVLKTFTSPNPQFKSKAIIKKYSTVDAISTWSESSMDKSSCQLDIESGQGNRENCYKGIKGDDVFVLPDIDEEVENKQRQIRNVSIEGCENGKFIIMKSIENAYIDGCSQSFIFVGPCHSTVFIRNCHNIKIRAISQQLRISNSQNITIQGIVGVKPVLQDCKNIKFRAMSCKIYDDLVWQMEVAQIDVFNNQIYECYDFTPNKIPNFSNYQPNQSDHSNANLEWEAKIEMNDLDWGMKNVYFPLLMPVKSSMLPKMLSETEVQTDNSITIIYGKGLYKEILIWLNCEDLHKNLMMIKRLDNELCLKMLKATNQRQKIQSMSKKEGNWLFLLVKMRSGKLSEKDNCGLSIVKQRESVCKILREHDKTQ